ncbi:MAG: DUF1080 domain-containing protein [Maribacter sp.]|uniref:3-keto-disaccharide hydrolase n=1 Tax=Maribacter sp. TaxID=1897614 RepID=UPI0032973285
MSSVSSHTISHFDRKLLSICFGVFLSFSLQSCKEVKPPPTASEKAPITSTETEGFVQIFDGKSLQGWNGDQNYWRVENGSLIGEVTPSTLLKNNTFIVWEGGEPSDFELKLEFRITEAGNSGINYRSDVLESIPFALRGYQADIDGKIRYTGQNYEERKRTTLAYRGEKVLVSTQNNPDEPGSLKSNVQNNCWQSREVVFQLGESDFLKTKIKFEDWNEMHLIVQGNQMKHFVNDILMSEVHDEDSINRKMSGKLGLQVHVGPPMKVAYRNIRLKKL